MPRIGSISYKFVDISIVNCIHIHAALATFRDQFSSSTHIITQVLLVTQLSWIDIKIGYN